MRIALLALSLLAAFAAAVTFALPEREAALRGVEYIRTTQQADGGFGGFGPGQTMDAIFAIRSAGIDPNSFVKEGKTPADFLRTHAPAVDRPGLAAKFVLGAKALGLNPRNVDGTDLVAVILNAYDAGSGRFASDDFNHSLSIIGLAATGTGVPSGAVASLRSRQLPDGGWGFGNTSDPDSTAIALQALLAAGVPVGDGSVQAALAYFRSTQAADGGWGFDPAASNVNSTAFVVQALLAAGEDPEGPRYTKGSANPIRFLLSQQRPDGSFVGYDPAFATNQVVPALMGRTYVNAPDTPIVQATPSPTPGAGATPTPTRTPTPVVARTGTGTAASSDGSPAFLAALGSLLFLGGGAVLLQRRRP